MVGPKCYCPEVLSHEWGQARTIGERHAIGEAEWDWQAGEQTMINARSSQSDTLRSAGLELAGARLQQQGNRGPAPLQFPHSKTASADDVAARRNPRGPQAGEVGHRYVHKGGSAVTTPRERLTPKEIQISVLVGEGLSDREIGKIVGTGEQ